ncbi:hypothetical protein [Marinitoga lauensis]|uniref:hypothetical protein n=1 Tax=Marinitoga lauensis TaxID=2201189 RepID=UPI0010103FB4|nr:hypothetical protein [Marinitoga lauensis]
MTFLSSFKKFLYGKNNYRTFDLTIKRLNEELPFESELLKQNLNNLFNKLSVKIIEIENIKIIIIHNWRIYLILLVQCLK